MKDNLEPKQGDVWKYLDDSHYLVLNVNEENTVLYSINSSELFPNYRTVSFRERSHSGTMLWKLVQRKT